LQLDLICRLQRGNQFGEFVFLGRHTGHPAFDVGLEFVGGTEIFPGEKFVKSIVELRKRAEVRQGVVVIFPGAPSSLTRGQEILN
jgi:hypothetical protein